MQFVLLFLVPSCSIELYLLPAVMNKLQRKSHFGLSNNADFESQLCFILFIHKLVCYLMIDLLFGMSLSLP